ncbi:MAG TPA: hypothetical protein PLV13_11945, partial [Ilumatobacteraceae bacterium]|nr:hypothetical protein [Ilumatobacteraceae bacterium]
MVLQLLIAAGVVVIAAVVGVVLRRRRAVEVPTQPRHEIPSQLDRADFAPDMPWVVAVFSSASCSTCADVKRKAAVLESPQ